MRVEQLFASIIQKYEGITSITITPIDPADPKGFTTLAFLSYAFQREEDGEGES